MRSFLPSATIPSRFCSHTRTNDVATAALNNHFYYRCTFLVLTKKSVMIFLTSLFGETKFSLHLVRPNFHVRASSVRFSIRNLQTTECWLVGSSFNMNVQHRLEQARGNDKERNLRVTLTQRIFVPTLSIFNVYI